MEGTAQTILYATELVPSPDPVPAPTLLVDEPPAVTVVFQDVTIVEGACAHGAAFTGLLLVALLASFVLHSISRRRGPDVAIDALAAAKPPKGEP